MTKGYKFRIYPNAEQESQIQRTFGCCRYVYNHYLAKRIEAYEAEKKSLNCNACLLDMTQLKCKLSWLKEADSTALQSSIQDLDDAYTNFFRRLKQGIKPYGFPRFKSKKNRQRSYTSKKVGENIAVLDGYIKLPKLGLVECRISKQVRGRILSVTISQSPSGKYFVSICCTEVDIPQLTPTGALVGIDLGIKDFATTSDGEHILNPRFLEQTERKLARLQRRLSRKPIGSKNHEKARVKMARLHEHIANQRLDFLHKTSTQIVQTYDTICIESLKVANMKRNRKLSKAISSVSWSEFTRQLTYKCVWYGKTLQKVDTFYASSQTCSKCGYKNAKVKNLAVREWTCPQCGAEHDRDVNASQNILNEGLRLIVA